MEFELDLDLGQPGLPALLRAAAARARAEAEKRGGAAELGRAPIAWEYRTEDDHTVDVDEWTDWDDFCAQAKLLHGTAQLPI